MQTVKIELETVTPLFLSGATQREPELRVPTLRGALRYMHGVSTEECPARQGSGPSTSSGTKGLEPGD